MTTSSTLQNNGTQETEAKETEVTQEVVSDPTPETPAVEKKPEALALAVKEEEKVRKDVSGIQIYNPGGLPGNRPISITNLQISETYASVGGVRPVFASNMEVSGSLVASGRRPIVKSTLDISKDIVIMGNRPVAPNEMDDTNTLMGYLD